MTAPSTTRLFAILIGLGAGVAAVLLLELDALSRPSKLPLLWLPSFIGVLIFQRFGWRGLIALTLGAGATRAVLWLPQGEAMLLPIAGHALAEGLASAWVGRVIARQLPRGLLRLRQLAPLLLRAVLPVALLAGLVQAAALHWLALPAPWMHVYLPLVCAQLLALLLAYVVVQGDVATQDMDGEQALQSQRRRNAVLLVLLGVSIWTATTAAAPAWLLVMVFLAGFALSADLRGLVLGLLLTALLLALIATAHGIDSPVVLDLQWNLWLSGAVLLLLALAIESAHREASCSQMATLVHARTEALQAELVRRRELESRYRACPHYDGLTGAPNRALLLDRLNIGLADARRQSTGLAVASLTLDGLQVINDSCGRSVGDRALSEVAARLRARLRGSDTVARVGGDEFVVIALRAPTPEAAAEVALRILACFDSALCEENPSLMVGASLGIALFPSHGETPETLLRKANAAMSDVKRSGSSGWMLYAGDAVSGESEASASDSLVHGSPSAGV